MDDDGDDRWTSFQNHDKNSRLGNKTKDEKKPELTEYLRVVLAQKSPRERQERKYKVALQLVKLVTNAAYNVSSEWKTYLEADNKTGVQTAPLRTLSEDKFDCLIPIKRPMRLDGLKVVPRPNDELPQHRCMIQVNPALSKEEQQLVYNEWDPCLFKSYLKPGFVLRWFNLGLDKACSVILSENHNVDKLTLTIGADHTAVLHATTSTFDGDTGLIIDSFTVNILPCFSAGMLPRNLKLAAPLPCFGPYIEGQKIFRQLVKNDIDEGNHVVLFTPKAELTSSLVQRLSPEDNSWKLNLSFTEYHVYSIIDKYCRGLNFRHVLVLFNILREENKDVLGIINNEILVNALFNVSQRHIDSIRQTSQWVFKLFETLIDGLKSGFLPSFYLPRMNLLACYSIQTSERLKTLKFLQTVLEDLKKDPKNVLKYTGFKSEKEEERAAEQVQNDYENEQKGKLADNKGLVPNESPRSRALSKASSSRRGYHDRDSERNSKYSMSR